MTLCERCSVAIQEGNKQLNLSEHQHSLMVNLGAVEYLTKLLEKQTERTVVTGIVELFLSIALDELENSLKVTNR